MASRVNKSEAKPVAPEYKKGDKVVKAPHGVAIVDSVDVRTISGCKQKFYTLTILENGAKITAAANQVETGELRKVVDEGAVDEIYEILRDRDVRIDQQTWNRRNREYTQKINTGSAFEIASVIRDLVVRQSGKGLSSREKDMLVAAQSLLVKEISIAKASSEEVVREEMLALCSLS